MKRFFMKNILFCVVLIAAFSNCAYFNTFYNAKQYFDEANKIRLEKDGQAIPITAMDKYGKAIEKCKKVLKDFPDSKLRIDAFLLMAKAQFYRSDYDQALNNLMEVSKHGSSNQKEEASYWKALCKWKKGNLQASMNDLNMLLSNSNSKSILSKCHLSIAEISKELNNNDLALFHLKKGAGLTQERDEKGVIYGRLAEMAFELEEYDIAKDGYTNVIAHSLAKERIENAHLQILKILRIEKKYRSASRKIKGLLADDKFKRIAGNLELELVNLYRAEGETDEIETRLESIVNDYQRTPVSAEAYYQLGAIYTTEKWNLEKAKEYFENVSKESNKSLFSSSAKSRVKSIGIYQKAKNDIELIISQSSNQKTDSTLSVSTVAPEKTLPELYYQIADLEAFTFSRYAESINMFEKVISEYPETEFKPKSMFALNFIYYQLQDTLKAKILKHDLIKQFPDSEYASYLSGNDFINNDQQRMLFENSEKIFKTNQFESIGLYKTALKYNVKGSLAAPAAYTIASYYDKEILPDSALKYYQFIIDNFPKTEQATKAMERREAINFAISIIEPDSTADTIMESN